MNLMGTSVCPDSENKRRLIRLTKAAKAGIGKISAEDRKLSISLVEIKAARISLEDATFAAMTYQQMKSEEKGGVAAEPRALLFKRIIELLKSPAVTDH